LLQDLPNHSNLGEVVSSQLAMLHPVPINNLDLLEDQLFAAAGKTAGFSAIILTADATGPGQSDRSGTTTRASAFLKTLFGGQRSVVLIVAVVAGGQVLG
jgi:hypothetical protein